MGTQTSHSGMGEAVLRAACELLNSSGVWRYLCSVLLLSGSIQGKVHPWIMRLQESQDCIRESWLGVSWLRVQDLVLGIKRKDQHVSPP